MALKEPILVATITTLGIPLTYAAYHQFWHTVKNIIKPPPQEGA
uniref:Uncharacterized protein n=1 Tax=viral metagenome TaxID=1070528 RepID=A0A6C0K3Q3_9ZZZZ